MPSTFAPALHFFGAARTVTGSRFLIETGRARVLVDCGLFQGLKELRLRNWERFPVDPRSLHAVVLTHAHLDHSGYLPALVRDGFAGPVYTTRNSEALCRILLPDSGRIQEEDAAYANRKGFSKHHPALPLYTEEDALRSLRHLRTEPFGRRFEVAPGIRVTFQRAGHILGAASVHLELDDHPADSVGISGDLGRFERPVLCAPDPPPACATLLVESTHGARKHEAEHDVEGLADAIVRTAERRGAVVIPAFSVDRTEVILLQLRRLTEAGRIPKLPVYADSPMALESLRLYQRAARDGDPEVRPELHGHPNAFDPGDLIEAHHVDDSKAIHEAPLPCIIVSASGMATGGRVLHHLIRRLPDPKNTVVLVGYQAEGTRGRSLRDGAKAVKIFGRYVPVHAEIVDTPGFSAHADAPELLAWLRQAPAAPRTAFVVHGEPESALTLEATIERELGWTAVVPQHGERVRID